METWVLGVGKAQAGATVRHSAGPNGAEVVTLDLEENEESVLHFVQALLRHDAPDGPDARGCLSAFRFCRTWSH